MDLRLVVLIVASCATSVLGQTFIVSACSSVSGQQVCRGPDGSAVTFGMTTTSAPSTTITSAPASTLAYTSSTASVSVTVVSECHYHSSTPFCFAGTAEYEMIGAPTRTQELASQYTACHSHGSEMFCVSPGGQDVEFRAEQAVAGNEPASGTSSNQVASAGSASTGMDCHFHGGVEHCVPVGGGERDTGASNCERQVHEYNIPLRVGMLFVVLATSAVAVFTPILLSAVLKNKTVSFVLLQLKQFGTGVLISTALVHLYTHAELMLTNSCITWPVRYEGTTAAIVMAGIFLSFLVEYVGARIINRRGSGIAEVESERSSSEIIADRAQNSTTKSPGAGSLAQACHGMPDVTGMPLQQQKLSVLVVEAGIIFHSILIGLTLVLAGDSVFRSLVVVIIFHQMFEGLALGTRIAELPSASASGTTATATATAVSWSTKYVFAGIFALITPLGMAIGLGVIRSFDGTRPATLLAIGTLDAVSAGILIWVALVEMLAHDWLLLGPLRRAKAGTVAVSLGSLMLGMVLMSVLGKWA